ncbi:MAG: hypothetical protein HYY16_06570 [Planctomycetes bacterium]|nr:hypothetical protein [Planctomycetota bacterium]
MKHFKRAEIATFLRAVDRHLSHGFDLVIIGGAAAALSFGTESGTMDIDLTAVSPRSDGGVSDIDAAAGAALIKEACKSARVETGLDIPMGEVGIWDAPYEFEGRFHEADEPRRRTRARGPFSIFGAWNSFAGAYS